MIRIKRTDSNDKDFPGLVAQLDKDLSERYGSEQLEYDRYNKIKDINTIVIAYLNDEPVGCGCFKNYGDHSVEVKRMFVVAGHRGKGIASAILNELEKWAKELQHQSIILETGDKQAEAIHLYQKKGYTVIPNYGQYSGMKSSICMKKQL